MKALAALAALAALSCVALPVIAAEAAREAAGDPARGRGIVGDRRVGMCLLCHPGPFPDASQQGDLAPDLRGAGRRYSVAELRQRIVDPSRLNADTVMPSFGRPADGADVAPAFRGKALLSDGQIDDVVAYLATLKD